MTAKDPVLDVSGTHPFCSAWEDQFDSEAIHVGLGQLEECEVGRPGVRAVVPVEDDVGPDEVDEVALVPAVAHNPRDVLAGVEHRRPLAVVHDRPVALEPLGVVVAVEGDPDFTERGGAAQKLDVPGVEQVERPADVDPLGPCLQGSHGGYPNGLPGSSAFPMSRALPAPFLMTL